MPAWREAGDLWPEAIGVAAAAILEQAGVAPADDGGRGVAADLGSDHDRESYISAIMTKELHADMMPLLRVTCTARPGLPLPLDKWWGGTVET